MLAALLFFLFFFTSLLLYFLTSLLLDSHLPPPQPQRIEHHRHIAKTHRRASQHRTQQPPKHRIENSRRNRYPNAVINKRKRQVLLDVPQRGPRKPPRPHDPSQIAFQQRNPRALDRDVSSCPHRNPHMSRRQRGRIIDAIARHRDRAAFRSQLLHQRALFLGQHFRVHFLNSQFRSNREGSLATVTRHHHNPNPILPQIPNRLRCRQLQAISKKERTRILLLDCHVNRSPCARARR